MRPGPASHGRSAGWIYVLEHSDTAEGGGELLARRVRRQTASLGVGGALEVGYLYAALTPPSIGL